MPLDSKQKKIVEQGCTSCTNWQDACAMLRRLGFPDPAMEERCQAAQATLEEAKKIVVEYESLNKGK